MSLQSEASTLVVSVAPHSPPVLNQFCNDHIHYPSCVLGIVAQLAVSNNLRIQGLLFQVVCEIRLFLSMHAACVYMLHATVLSNACINHSKLSTH